VEPLVRAASPCTKRNGIDHDIEDDEDTISLPHLLFGSSIILTSEGIVRVHHCTAPCFGCSLSEIAMC
jgi:hypothetical protein